MQVVAEAAIRGYSEIKCLELLVWGVLLAPKPNQEAGGLRSGVTTNGQLFPYLSCGFTSET